MERFWRTLREGCLNFLGDVVSLQDLNARLQAFLDRRYHTAPHAGLMGKSPAKVYAQKPAGEGAIDETRLRTALTVRSRRRLSADNVLSLDGKAWELDQGFLAGQLVTVAHCFAAAEAAPWVEHEGKRLTLRPSIPSRMRDASGPYAPAVLPKAEPAGGLRPCEDTVAGHSRSCTGGGCSTGSCSQRRATSSGLCS
ncbi:hypothetical protein WMF43_37375 [Sorangium sp. So ce131]